MTRVREIIMATLGLLPVAANAASPSTEGTEEQQRRPNIIFIMCDDMGYGDLGCYGQQRIETPNLDRMAQEGMRFTQAYAGSPVSAPSRASFMTGQHTGHTHVRGNREYWRSSSRANMYGNNADYSLIGQEPYLMNHKIIPEVMKEAGYNTGMFGKWAGGYYNTDHPNTYLLDANGNSDTSKSGQSSSASLPNKRGIDCYYGYICQFQAHTYYPNFLNRYDPEKYGDKHVVVDVLEENIKHKSVATGDRDFENRSQYTSDLIHQYALEWIDRQAEKDDPFLGIFTYTLPHAELWQPQDSLVAKYKEKFKGQDGGDWGGEFGSWYYRAPSRHAQFAAMISRLDAQVGEIFEKLEEKGIADNTLVIFTSDNGPHTEGGADPTWFNSNGGLQGTKRQTHEGGVRVPFIAKGPGVPAGVVNDHQLAFYDVMPTLLDYAGADGSAYSLEASTDERRYDGISFYNTLTGNDAEQEKHEFLYWEFHETNQVALRMGDWKLVAKSGVPALYDLSKDPHEDNNVAAQNPKVLRQMLEIIHQQHTASSMFNVTMPEVPEDDGSEVVTEVKTGNLYTLECQPNDGHSTRFISDTDGVLNGQTAKGTMFRFEEAANGGYYIKSTVSGKYINANAGKTDISFDAEPKSAWTLGQIDKNDAYVYFTIGESKYLNNHQGGEDNLRLATHNPIAQNNKCSLWTLHEYADENAGEGEDDDDVMPTDVSMHFSFSRGTSLDNTEVTVTDAQGQKVDGVSAQISASGAASWLTGNQAAADSILCVNVNTSATTADKPIVFTLQVNGLEDNVHFSNFTFSSVALNAAGLWQSYTETRHCNFLCSYSTRDGGMEELPMLSDESIMVANGAPKYVSFDVEKVTPVAGGLTIELKLYKGTENGGCFYGLTGVTLNGGTDNATKIASPDAGAEFKDGIYLQDEEIVIIRNNQRYNLKGQKLR
ncbi:MAG: sulfatase-like hydrolase/transferase [Bacteroidaceae bacterium]|nr:sulfatase-like hydrolase/transferase [Bacteroidaceae bacterium]